MKKEKIKTKKRPLSFLKLFLIILAVLFYFMFLILSYQKLLEMLLI
jgi:hypothetical protein